MQAQQQFQFEDLNQIILEGYLDKQSRFLKKWHKRWVVLTRQTLYTFKQEKSYRDPTEVINLQQILSIRGVEEEELNRINAFKIETFDCIFYLVADNEIEKEKWIGKIGKEIVQLKQSSKL